VEQPPFRPNNFKKSQQYPSRLLKFLKLRKSFCFGPPVDSIKQNPSRCCYSDMTKPANSKDKPSPADTPTERPADTGGKAKRREADKTYQGNNPHGGDIANRHENDEQPVHSADKKG
jgi:hypothetical protein